MLKLLPLAATVHVVFALYLLMAGAGVQRTVRLAARAIGLSAALGAIALFAYPYFLLQPLESFVGVVLGSTLLTLPLVILSSARDLVVPPSNLLQVVLVNVLALSLGAHGGISGFLLNPLEPLLPSVGPWLVWIVSLWPTAVALALAYRGPPGDLRLRFILNVWVQAMGFVWLLPTAFAAVEGFDATSAWAYASSIIACLCAAQVALSAVTFFVLVSDKDRRGETQRLAALIAERMEVRPRPLWLLAGVAAFLVLLQAVQALVPDRSTVLTAGYVVVFVLGATAGRASRHYEAEAPGSRSPAPTAPFSLWRFRFLLLLFVFFALPLHWLNLVRGERSFVVGTPSWAIITGIWVVLAGGVLYVLLRAAWVVAESQGFWPSAGARRLAWWVGAATLGGWQGFSAPSPAPVGGLDGMEQTLKGRRVFIWYARELGPFRSGRALYLESPDGERRPIAACSGETFGSLQSFRVRADGSIECRWPEHLVVVNADGLDTLTGAAALDGPLPVSPLGGARPSCAVAGDASPELRCRGTAFGVTPVAQRGLRPPVSLNLADTRQFAVRVPDGEINCVELTAVASLDGAEPTSVPAVVLYDPARLGDPGAAVWVHDLGASCRRLFIAGDGGLWYAWDKMTAPLNHETHTRLPMARRLQPQGSASGTSAPR